MSDLLMQQLSTVQSDKQPVPPTVPSAATLVPVTFLTFVTGTVPVTSITPFVSGEHMIMLVFTNATPGIVTAGTGANSIKASITPTQNVPVLLVYDPVSAQWWGGVLKTS